MNRVWQNSFGSCKYTSTSLENHHLIEFPRKLPIFIVLELDKKFVFFLCFKTEHAFLLQFNVKTM